MRASDIEKLGDNEAVCYGLRGKLSTTIEGSWADALTANLTGLSSFLQTNTPIAIKINLGADFKLAAEIVDDFQLIFAREKEGRVRLGVRKSKVEQPLGSGKRRHQCQVHRTRRHHRCGERRSRRFERRAVIRLSIYSSKARCPHSTRINARSSTSSCIDSRSTSNLPTLAV